MAQSKSRIVIWVIVGLLVVVAAGMLLFGKKDPSTIPFHADDVPAFVEKMDRWLNKEAKGAAELRATFGESDAAVFAEFDATMEKVRALLAQMPATTDDKELGKMRDDAKKHLSDMKALMKPLEKEAKGSK